MCLLLLHIAVNSFVLCKSTTLRSPQCTALQEASLAKLSEPSSATDSSSQSILRCLIWFHHIKSLTKRKHIVAWAHELDIGGYSKPGFPGIIVCEGEKADVIEYLRRIRQLRWQAMSVRAEDFTGPTDTPDADDLHNRVSAACTHPSKHNDESPASISLSHAHASSKTIHRAAQRLLCSRFTELSERSMDQLAAECQAAGLEELFLTSMKIAK